MLVTGASGFIGSHLTRALIEKGFEVGITKRKESNLNRIEDLASRLTFYDVDLADTQAVLKIITDFGPDAVIHLAAYYVVEHTPQEISTMVDTNVLGAINLLDASKEAKVKLFINTSSCFVYKASNDKVNEDSELSPLNLYALTKMGAEQACTFYAKKYDLRAVSFRLFPPYGPADNDRKLIPFVIKNLTEGNSPRMTTGTQRWDFTYVGDIVDAYLRLLSVSELPQNHEVFNIGAGNAVSIREVVSSIIDVMGCNVEPEWGAVPHRSNEIWHLCADTSKARKLLGWKPGTSLKEGLRLTTEYFGSRWRNAEPDRRSNRKTPQEDS